MNLKAVYEFLKMKDEQCKGSINRSNYREIILQAIGQASLCWMPIPTGIFDTKMALKIAEQLLHDLEEENANSGYPLLADVLAEFEPMIFDFVESENKDKVRLYLRNILGKYFG